MFTVRAHAKGKRFCPFPMRDSTESWAPRQRRGVADGFHFVVQPDRSAAVANLHGRAHDEYSVSPVVERARTPRRRGRRPCGMATLGSVRGGALLGHGPRGLQRGMPRL